MHAFLGLVKMVVVLVRGLISVIKHYDQNQLGKFISTYWPIVQFITEESQGGNLEAGTNAKAIKEGYSWFLLKVCSSQLPYSTQDQQPRDDTTHINHLLKYPTGLPIATSYGELFLYWDFSLLEDSGCTRLT